MIKNDVFLEDVKVPEIVQKKADSAFLAIQTERSNRMNQLEKKNRDAGWNKSGKIMTGKKFARNLAAVAACMAVIIASGALIGPLKGILGDSGAGNTDDGGKGPEDAFLSAVNQIDKMFTLQVKAAGSEEGQLVPLAEGNQIPVISGDGKSKSWVFCSDGTDIVNYCIGLPQIICEGDQIESITYSINNGAFQIVQPEDGESIIMDGQLYDGELNTGSIGGDYDEERDGQPSRPFEIVLYKSVTLDYGRQSDEYTWINICNERPDSEEIIQLLWGEDGSEEAESSGIQKMLDDIIITCTVHYADDTSQSADIKVGSCVITRKEAGEPLDEGIDPEEEMTVITFELQQGKTDTK